MFWQVIISVNIYVFNNIIKIANITSKKSESDCPRELNVREHSFVDHESVVNYADAIMVKCDKVEKWIWLYASSGKTYGAVEQDILKRIVDGAKISDAFPPKYLKFIP